MARRLVSDEAVIVDNGLGYRRGRPDAQRREFEGWFLTDCIAFCAAGRTVGHERDQEGKYLLEGGRDRGGEGHGVGPRGGIMDSHQHQFCLKWNSFGSNLATAFSNLFKSESLTDVTLFCEGKFYFHIDN